MTAGFRFKIHKFRLLNSGFLIVNFEQVSHVVILFLLLTLNNSIPPGRVPLRFSD